MVEITDAPQVSGIEGSYRNTCEISMRVLRDNKESLMAVLEAFVYDPLINWRLMPTKGDTRRPPGEQLSIQTEMSTSSHTKQVTRHERQNYLASMHTSKNPFAS